MGDIDAMAQEHDGSARTTVTEQADVPLCGINGCGLPAVELERLEGAPLWVGWCSSEHEACLRFIAAIGRLRDPSIKVHLLDEHEAGPILA